MAPLLELESCFKRNSDSRDEEEPRKVYSVICEGEKTEVFYFSRLFALFEEMGLPKNVGAVVYDKVGEDKSASNPKKLLSLAEEHMQNDSFEVGDQVAIVFDADIYRNKAKSYRELIERCHELNVIPCVTFPSFELFLLLHKANALEEIIWPHESEIVGNVKTGGKKKRTYIEQLFRSEFKMKPKSNPNVAQLADGYQLAISAEKSLNQDYEIALGRLSSNVGAFLERMLNE